MATSPSASPGNLNATLYVSTIDISLARDSNKKIESFQLKKNDRPHGGPVSKIIGAGEDHRHELTPPLPLTAGDCITVLVNCNCRMWKQVNIDFSLRDIDCMRMEDNGRSYRKKIRNIEVVLNGHHSMFESLLATTAPILQSCPRFRLLVMGNSGVGKSSLIHKVFGVDDVRTSENIRGDANINQEYKSRRNERFVVHDSLGFEAGDRRNIGIVKEFVAKRQANPKLEDRLHAIWLCLEIPYSDGRLLEAGVEEFLQRKDEILGKVPLVVVLTKLDLVMAQLDIDLPENQDFDSYKSEWFAKHCIQPLRKAAGNSVVHVAVSRESGYSECLTDLIKATMANMDEYHADDTPRLVASIAQRISAKDKIELSIAIGKKQYWKTLLNSAVFRGHTVKECLQVILTDVITIWNFSDPDNCLMDDKIIEGLLSLDNHEASTHGASNAAPFAGLLAAAAELTKSLAGAGEPVMAILAPVAGVVISLLQMSYDAYREAKKDAKIFMAFIVDLICVMQMIFLLTSGGLDRVTSSTADRAVQAYRRRVQTSVHQGVNTFDQKMGVFLGTRDRVLEQVETLIWRYSITDRQFEELKKESRPGPLSSFKS